MNNKCVYLLVDKDKVVRYVGQGSIYRANSNSGRSLEYIGIRKDKGSVIIVKDDLSREEALSLENLLIEKHQSSLINKKASPVSNKLLYIELSKHLKLCDKSPSGLIWHRENCPKSLVRFNNKNAGGYNKDKVQHGWSIQIEGKQIKAHRIIWCLYHKVDITDPDTVINHIDFNPLNNQIRNLELVTQRVNMLKRSKFKTNTSGVTGVSLGSYHKGCLAYSASTIGKTSGLHKKSFSVNVHGLLPAFAKACQWREDKIKELIANNDYY